MTFDNEWKCKACGAVGLNELEEEEEVRGDEVIGILKVIVCECGHSEVLEDYDIDGDIDEENGVAL